MPKTQMKRAKKRRDISSDALHEDGEVKCIGKMNVTSYDHTSLRSCMRLGITNKQKNLMLVFSFLHGLLYMWWRKNGTNYAGNILKSLILNCMCS